MTDRIKYNEATGKVEVDADVWDMIVAQMPGNCVMDEVKTRKLWAENTSRGVIAQHLNISHNQYFRWVTFTGTKNKFILSEIYPECIVLLEPTTQPKHEFRKSALISLPKTTLQKMAAQSNQSIQNAVNKLLSGKMNNPTVATVVTMSKITGVSIQCFITSDLPTTTPSAMVRIKQMAITEKTNILATVIREFKLVGKSIAQGIGVEPSTIFAWKHDKAPKLDGHVALCKYFNVPFDYFSDWLE